MNFSYKVQFKPTGIPEAFKLGRKFIGKSNVLLVLGDNIFYTKKKINILKNSIKNLKKDFLLFLVIELKILKDME